MNAWDDGSRCDDAMGPSVSRPASVATITRHPPLKNGGELRETGYLIGIGSRTARFRRKHRKKIYWIILLILLFIITFMGIMLTLVYKYMFKPPPNICLTKECLRSAANLALSIDKTAQPCEDFYQYMCGNWPKNHPRPDEYISFDWFSDQETRVYAAVRDFLEADDPTLNQKPKPVQQTKIMYEACMDVKTLEDRGLEPVIDMLDEIGLPHYPTIINTRADKDLNYTFDWLEAVIKIKKKLGMDVLIGFDIFFDSNNFTNDNILIGAPEVTHPFPSMHGNIVFQRSKNRRYSHSHFNTITNSKKENSHSKRQPTKKENEDVKDKSEVFYIELMKYFIEEEAKISNNTKLVSKDRLKEIANIFYDFNEEMNEIMSYNETDETEVYETQEYTVKQIHNITDSVLTQSNGTAIPIWRRYFEGIFTVKDEKLDFEKEKISISQLDLEYLCVMAAYVSKTPPIHLELYIWMKVIEVLAVDTTQTLYQLFLKIYPTDVVAARSLRCANAVNEMLGMAVAYAIAEPDFISVVKPEIEVMLKNLKGALAHLIGETKWMDDNTKLKSYRKIIEMKTLIGFPDWLLEEGQLESYYKGVEVNKKTHLENMISIAQMEIKAKMDDYKKPRPNLWYIDPTVVNAYHVFATNTITVPMVILQYPFYDLGLDSLNYGSLGTIIGHEITHGFDNLGRLYDKDGYSKNWWSNETVDSYQNVTECLVKQYSSFKIPELGKNIDGHKTLGENIADNGAIRQSFSAFERQLRRIGHEAKLPGFEEYTPQQMFFMSYGNLDLKDMRIVTLYFFQLLIFQLWCGISTNDSLKASLEDEHSPLKFRVKGSLQNIEQFARTWNCPPDSPMNPTKKCVIF
ncbi:PREDICTED: neprilysin-2-like [Papilio polytes]|uniref:neprilysin-2-like n=1 Tax=Papilio polytes TaxID=76194 RepID=UPI000676478F|nr:PREDICTED: neprilysin-2-like [Papilio polytes]